MLTLVAQPPPRSNQQSPLPSHSLSRRSSERIGFALVSFCLLICWGLSVRFKFESYDCVEFSAACVEGDTVGMVAACASFIPCVTSRCYQ